MQGGFLEPVQVLFAIAVIVVRIFLAVVVFGAEDNGPARGEWRMVVCQVVAFEEETAENGSYGKVLTVGEVDNCARHDDGVTMAGYLGSGE